MTKPLDPGPVVQAMSNPTSFLAADLQMTSKNVGFQWVEKEIKYLKCLIQPNFGALSSFILNHLSSLNNQRNCYRPRRQCLHLGYSIRATYNSMYHNYTVPLNWYWSNFWSRCPRLINPIRQSYPKFWGLLSRWHRWRPRRRQTKGPPSEPSDILKRFPRCINVQPIL